MVNTLTEGLTEVDTVHLELGCKKKTACKTACKGSAPQRGHRHWPTKGSVHWSAVWGGANLLLQVQHVVHLPRRVLPRVTARLGLHPGVNVHLEPVDNALNEGGGRGGSGPLPPGRERGGETPREKTYIEALAKFY